MPALQHSGNSLINSAVELLTSLTMFIVACLVIRVPAILIIRWLASEPKRKQIFLLGSVAFCLLIVQLGTFFKQSMELSCFVAGVIVATDKKLSESVIETAEPLKEVFSALFFASLGLHIYPSFLLNEGLLLLTLALSCMLFKILITTGVMSLLFKQSIRPALLVGIGLGQISEFTFILASKGTFHLIKLNNLG